MNRWPLVGRRRHDTTVAVVEVLVRHPGRRMSGYELARTVDQPAGLVHAALAELEAAGVVESWLAGGPPRAVDRGRGRRFYRLAGPGDSRR